MSDEARSDRLEPGGVSTRWVTTAAGGFLLLLAVSIVVLGFVFYLAVPGNRIPPYRQFPAPQQTGHPAAETRALFARQQQELNSYRWTNPDHTLVAIPIDRAMSIIAARGAKAYEPIEQQKAASAPNPPNVMPPMSGGKP